MNSSALRQLRALRTRITSNDARANLPSLTRWLACEASPEEDMRAESAIASWIARDDSGESTNTESA